MDALLENIYDSLEEAERCYGVMGVALKSWLNVQSLEEIEDCHDDFNEEELWSVPSEVLINYEMTELASTSGFSIGHMAFCTTPAGLRLVFECNASPYFVWRKRKD